MRYQIQTLPIIDAFKSECDCPLCVIEASVTTRLVEMYLGEAVMQPEFRVRVNKSGFCSQHLSMLYAKDNKLGLSLQLGTHTERIIAELKPAKNTKAAIKLANRIKSECAECVICAEVDEIMRRYAITVAQMFLAEPDFDKLLASCAGFCMPHYARLLENSTRAGAKAEHYLHELHTVQVQSLSKTNRSTERFIRMFDYDSAEKQFKGSDEVVKKAINRLQGEIIK